MKKITRNSSLLIAAVIGIHAIFFFIAPTGFKASDDAAYAFIAHKLSQSQFELSASPFIHRFGVTIPTAIIYKAVGVHRYSVPLWPFLCSVITIIIVFLVARDLFSTQAALFSAFLLSTNLVQIKYASHLMPDLIVSMFMILSVVALYYARESGNKKKRMYCVTLCIFSLIGGLFTKSAILLVVPFFIGVMICDLVRRQHYDIWFWVTVLGLFSMVLYFGLYYLIADDPFYRIKVIDQTHNRSIWSFAGRSQQAFIKRMFYEPLLFLITTPGYVIPMVLSLPVFISLHRSRFTFFSNISFWAGFGGAFLFSFWFFSTSLGAYNPLPVTARFLSPLLPVLILFSGLTLSVLLDSISKSNREHTLLWNLIGISFLFASSLVVFEYGMGKSSIAIAYAVLGCCFFLGQSLAILQKSVPIPVMRASLKAMIILFSICLPVFAIYKGSLGESSEQIAERRIITNHLSNLSASATIFADRRCVPTLFYYFGFELPEHIKIDSWSKINEAHITGDKWFVLFNKHRLERLSRLYKRDLPEYATSQPPNWKLVEQVDGVHLFEVVH